MPRGKRVEPERARLVLELIASGMKPYRAAEAAGVSWSVAYGLERKVRGVSRRGVPVISPLPQGKAAGIAGVPASTARRLVARMGGVCQMPASPLSDRYLSREERYEIARLRESGLPVRKVAAAIGRAPSTVSRELRRNAGPPGLAYQPERAQWLARERQARPKQSRISGDPRLRAAVQGMLDRRYSPEQASGRLTVEFPDDPSMRISHETIYQSIYIYPRGELRKELRASLRRGRSARRPRGRGPQGRGKIIGAVPIGQRPPEAEGRLVPGHHEGDLVMGSTASNSAVATIVERMTGYLTLLPLPGGHGAVAVADAVIARMTTLPSWFARTLTWDNGKEMARHARITDATGINVYFADPYAPWQRGTNENTNGLLREYLPKGTDLSSYTQDQIQAIQDELNDRPRKRLGYRTPREELDRLLAQETSVATTP